MKAAYPIILTPDDSGYLVYAPDFDINTEGQDLTGAIEMAADAIGLTGISLQDMGRDIPAPSSSLPCCGENEIAAYALVDFDAYRRANDMRTVRKNVTIPSYLNELATRAGVNFSQVLQDSLKQILHVQ